MPKDNQDKVKKPLLDLLKNNPNKWISSSKLVKVTGFDRHAINYNLRKFEERGIVERKKERLEGSGSKVAYVKYKD